MNRRLFYNNPAFRLAAPPLFGVAIYLMILMFFDSVGMLLENFFSREIMFIFGLTYVVFEANRGIIILLNKFFSLDKSVRLRILIQYLVGISITALLVSLILFLYFRYIEGFTTIQTELITFTLIYLLVVAFYHLYHLSIVFLYKRNDRLVEQELQQKQHLQLELNAFKNQVNPEFLFQSLETVISSLHESKKRADELVDNLAKSYRYTLDNRHNDLVTLKTEIESLDAVRKIYEARFPGAIFIESDIAELSNEANLVPCTLNILLEKAVLTNIISESLPLHFKTQLKGKKLIIGYNENKRLRRHDPKNTRMEFLEKAYKFFSKDGIQISQKQDFISYQIPLIKIEEE